jgi:CshA-type fibril repeat protein
LATGTQLQTTGATATCLYVPSTTTCDADNVISIAGEGVFTLNPATGVVTFVADSNAVAGSQTVISYRVTDITGQTATSTLTPVVPPAPSAVANTSAGNYDTDQTLSVLSNDTPGDASAPLVASTVKLCASGQSPSNCNATTVSVANQGTYTVNSDGSVTFDPLPTFSGTATAVTYQVADSLGQVTSATITPTVYAPPNAVNDTSSGNYDTNQVISPLSNDVDGSGTIDATTVKLCSSGQVAPNCTGTTLTVTGEGTYTVNANGTVTFDPLPSFTGTASPITYQVADSLGQTDSATITPTVGAPPLPAAADDTSSGVYDTNQVISPIANDTRGATDFPFVASTLKLCGASQTPPACNATSLTVANEGTYTVNADGTVTFDPLPTFKGTATPVAYQVADTLGRIDDALITPTVAAPTAPTATAQTQSVLPGGTATFTTITGTSGLATGTQLQTTGANATCLITPSSSPASCDADNVVTIANEGTYTLNPSTGVVTFVASQTITGGTKTPITYRVTDITGQTATSTLTPVVPPAPVPANDTSIGNYDTNQVISPLANDTPGDASAPLVASTVKLCGSGQSPNNCNVTTLVVDGQGTYTVNANGTVTFDPLPSFTGTATAIRYQAADTLGQIENATITVTVRTPPNAVNDVSSGNYDTDQLINPLSNDVDGSGTIDPTTVKLCSAGQSAPNCTATSLTVSGEGTYTVNTTTGVVTFNPLPSFTGTATPITYQVSDSFGQTDSATITPTVGLPPLPIAVNDTSTGNWDTNQTITPTSNDTPGSSSFPFVATSVKLCATGQSAPSCNATTLTVANEGTYTVNANGTVTFDPLPTFSGTATPVTYQATDTLGRIDDATITPTVTPPPAPVATPETKAVIPGGTATFTTITGTSGLATGTQLQTSGAKATCLITPSSSPAACDADNVVTVAGEGTFTLNPATGVVTFVADANATAGTKTALTYRVTDITGQTATSTLTPVIPQPPVANPDTNTDNWDTNQTISPLTNDTAGAVSAPLVASTVKLCGISPAQSPNNCSQTTLTVANQGTYTVNANGTVTFDPLPTFNGTATAVRYQVSDTLGQVANTTITPTVNAPRTPTATPDTNTGNWDSNQTISPLTNDTPGESTAPLDATTVKLCGVAPNAQTPNNCSQTTLTIANQGTYTVNANGTVTFDPLPSFTGTATAVKYQVTDVIGQTVNTTITPTVLAPPAPVASPGTVSLIAGGTKDFAPIFGTNALAAKATGGPDLTNSTVCIVDPATPTVCGTTSVTIAGEGTFTLDATTGIVTYTALSTATAGAKTAISYKITDALGVTVTSTLTPTIIPKPTARPDTSIGVMEKMQTLSPVGNDSPGAIAYPLDATTVLLCGASETAPACTKTTVTVAGEGTYVVKANGTVQFTPESTYYGTATPMPYSVRDSLGQVAHSTLNPKVVPPPAPITELDTGTAEQGSSVVLSPWNNDNGGVVPSGVTGTVELVPNSIRLCGPTDTAPNCTRTSLTTDDGTYTVNTTTGQVTFVHRAGFIGTVTQPVTYQIANNWTGASGIGITTNILIPTIIPPAPPAPAPAPVPVAVLEDPHAVVDVSVGAWDTNQIISVFSNDVFPGSDASLVSIKLCATLDGQMATGLVSQGCAETTLTISGEGTYTVNVDGTVTFDPLPSFHGTATPIRYQAVDKLGRFVNSTITPTVEAPPVVITVSNELPATGENLLAEITAFLLLAGCGVGLRRRFRNA